jgi:hypothetical protein
MCRKLFYLVSVLFLSLSCMSKADESLVAYYSFENDVLDRSGNELNGTILGDPGFTIGAFGTALDLDGDGDYVDCGNDPKFDILDEVTVAVWINIRSLPQAWSTVIAKGDAAWRISNNGTSMGMHFAFEDGTRGWQAANTATLLETDEWYHICGTYDTIVGAKIYLNSVVDGTNPDTEGITLSTWNVCIGANQQYFEDDDPRYWDGLIDEIYIFNRALTEVQIYSLMVGGNTAIAWKPKPGNNKDELVRDATLSWNAGEFSDKHNVYLGTDFNDVNEASIDNPLDVLVSQNQDGTTYRHPDYLEFEQTYYWRIDEVNDLEPNSPWKGNVWSFTTANFVVVEDFENYEDYPPNEVFTTWVDGWGDPTNGSTAGHPAPDFVGGEHYLESNIVHGDRFSLPLFYDNSAGLSWATRTLTADKDWTGDDAIALTIYFYGDAGNEVVPMYVALNDDAVVTHPEPRAVMIGEWTRWDIVLQDFADMGVDLTNVNSITLGFGDITNPTAGGEGCVFFDDIRLDRSQPEEYVPRPDSVDPGNANLMAYYDFENDVQDNSGKGRHGTAFRNPTYTTGATGFGSAIQLNGTTQYIGLPIDSLIASLDDMTITCWANFSNVGGSYQRLWDFGVAPPDADTDPNIYMFVTPRSGNNGPLQFAITTGGNDTQSNVYASATLPSGWHHVAASIDSSTMTMRLYQDGKLVAEDETSFLPSDLGATDQNYIGKSQWTADAYYNGSIDELRIYNRVLTEAELLYLMGW